MCHGFIDPRFLMRETEARRTDTARVPATDLAPRPPGLMPGLVAVLRRLFARPQPGRSSIPAE